MDPTTHANYLEITSTDVAFDWKIDFDKKIIRGSATHHLTVNHKGVPNLVLDTADLVIHSVEWFEKGISGQENDLLKHSLGKRDPVMGSALKISLPSGLKEGQSIAVKIHYETTPESTALQWLKKEQTQGKMFPYLFSQCQPIYARTLAPLQDTPSVKVRYTATVTSILPVLLSAIRVSPPSEGPAHDGKVVGRDEVAYVYNQPIPIPSYLIAIASGDVVYKAFDKIEGKEWTSGVWAEPGMIDAAYWEFSADTARFLAKAEDIVTPYRFGVYDLLVLPPSFPYGGMENACLTFLTPTLITGDRSLVDVVVHELTHSYFGNGVTHANASHFWLNEGWTTYIERVLQQFLYSPAERGFSFLIGSKALDDALKSYEKTPKYQRLIIPFEKGEDPDDAYSSIPYEKGANFILHLEQTLGGLDILLPYVKDYVNTYTGKSITTELWKEHLYRYYSENGGAEKVALLDTIDWDAWFNGEGLTLPVEMTYDTSLGTEALALAARWDEARASTVAHLDFKEFDMDSFNSNQKVVFLERLHSLPALPSDHIIHLATLYKFSKSANAEIRLRFYELAMLDPISVAAQKYAPEAANWVTGADGTGVVKGRMKFCRPIFRDTYKVSQQLATEVWLGSRDSFHPIAKKLIEKDLGITK